MIRPKFVFRALVVSCIIGTFFLSVGLANAAVSQPDESTLSTNISPAWVQKLGNGLERAYALGWIDNVGIKESLINKFQAVVNAKMDKVLAKAFLNELGAQKNKHISEQEYQLIKEDME